MRLLFVLSIWSIKYTNVQIRISNNPTAGRLYYNQTRRYVLNKRKGAHSKIKVDYLCKVMKWKFFDWNGPKKAIPYLERCVIQMIKIAWRKSFTENVYAFRFICCCLIFLASMKLWVISGDMYCNRYVS